MNERCRLDVWLWRARFFKTRALAAAAVAGGGVRLARAGSLRRIDKPGEAIGAGDELTIATARGLASLRIAALGERRGPAVEARTLYVRLDGPELDDPEPGGHVSGA